MTKLSLILLAFTGCFSSMVDNPCQDGYVYEDHSCIARTAMPDAGGGGGDDDGGGGGGGGHNVGDPPEAEPQVCVLPEVRCEDGCKNLQIDPDNCGSCGHVCASGLCTAGHCVGEPFGHIVVIGHDYTHYHPSMARVLANAVSLGASYDVAVSWWPEGAHSAPTTALAGAMVTHARPWHAQAIDADHSLRTTDVLIVDGVTSAAEGMAWAAELDAFVHRGGVVIVLEGAGGTGHLFAAGAHLLGATTPVDVTNQQMVISSATDSIAEQVIAPYLGESSTVSFPGLSPAVITTTGGAPVVIHLVR